MYLKWPYKCSKVMWIYTQYHLPKFHSSLSPWAISSTIKSINRIYVRSLLIPFSALQLSLFIQVPINTSLHAHLTGILNSTHPKLESSFFPNQFLHLSSSPMNNTTFIIWARKLRVPIGPFLSFTHSVTGSCQSYLKRKSLLCFSFSLFSPLLP